MAIQGIQNINIGLPNESAGSDSLFTAFNKAQTNFTNLFDTASPVPIAGAGVSVQQVSNSVVVSANLVAGNNVILTTVDGAIVIDSLGDPANGTITGSSANITGNLVASGNIGYNIATNHATVTQETNKTTEVTANGRSGQITTSNASLPQNSSVTFTVNNSFVSANDVIILNIQSGATVNTYTYEVAGVNTGEFLIQLRNQTNSAIAQAIVFNFAVIKVN